MLILFLFGPSVTNRRLYQVPHYVLCVTESPDRPLCLLETPPRPSPLLFLGSHYRSTPRVPDPDLLNSHRTSSVLHSPPVPQDRPLSPPRVPSFLTSPRPDPSTPSLPVVLIGYITFS